MLKIRVMPTLLWKDLGLVKGVSFDSWRRVGSAVQAIKVYNLRQVDELVLLDINATLLGRPPDFALVDDLADDCFMPMTVGGGVGSLQDAQGLLQVGADKVAINTAAVLKPELIRELALRFGSQCVVASMDVKALSGGGYEVYTHSGTRPSGLDPVAWGQRLNELGAGEILLTSIDRDGTMQGYDLELTRRVSNAVDIPVIASGGASCYEDMHQVLTEGGASAVAAASIFHFTQQTPMEAKRFLAQHGLPVRL